MKLFSGAIRNDERLAYEIEGRANAIPTIKNFTLDSDD